MDEPLKHRLFALELELLEPATRASVARLSALLDEAFVEFGASGRCIDRQVLLQALPAEAGAVRYRAFDLQAWLLAPDLAQLRYRSERRDGDDAGAPVRRALRSSLWRCRDGEWRMLFHQGTPIPGAA
ncbi:nuclear transport factor 2 family protein [Xanthomonas translucens pv. graminis]|uniref:nuclear transport factor 2 family protein n=1 Tax=Xanthomonas graminis TaxID=3390026 RepID=UPI002540A684|nr:nuclear transport factor 2 family protein [Xanthomonas translucens]WIH06781.1 nuclear transport factor 2 family protein [Xanthomonas translucens pv. graminis]